MIPTFNIPLLLTVAAIMGGLFIFISLASNLYGLNGIKNKTVGNGQHGTARWASKKDIKETYTKVDYEPSAWRTDEKKRPKEQGIVVGCETVGKKTVGLVDTGDVHCMMIGAAGVGKTAYWLYPNIEYACASGMSFMTTDTKGDILRNYGTIATKHYGYRISVIDLRNPMRSHGNNLLHLVNKYMDLYAEHPEVLAYKAKAEKYAKIISKTIILSGMDAGSFGQNAYFYDAAEGVLTASILLVAEFCKPEERHIVSVFKIIQELLAPSNNKQQKNQLNSLMAKLPDDHKAKWFAGAALNTSEQSMASVMSTALSRLNAFLDSELETILCNDTEIDAERFCAEKSAIFIIMPEEDSSKYFMVSLIIQQLYREILAVADEWVVHIGYLVVDRAVFSFVLLKTLILGGLQIERITGLDRVGIEEHLTLNSALVVVVSQSVNVCGCGYSGCRRIEGLSILHSYEHVERIGDVSVALLIGDGGHLLGRRIGGVIRQVHIGVADNVVVAVNVGVSAMNCVSQLVGKIDDLAISAGDKGSFCLASFAVALAFGA